MWASGRDKTITKPRDTRKKSKRMVLPNCCGVKEDGLFRLCADLVVLNKILKLQKHSLLSITDFMSLAHGCNRFSSLNVKDAFYKISVKESDRHKLTITCPLGNFS